MLHSEKELAALLGEVKTIAIIGAKDKPGQAVDAVGRYLIDAGYHVIPVHPVRATVWGLPAYKSMLDIAEPLDLINLFRAADSCPAHAEEVLQLATLPRCFWMQSGIRSPASSALLAGHPIKVIEDRCLMVDHQRLLGNGGFHG
jgi:hypothetical protein